MNSFFNNNNIMTICRFLTTLICSCFVNFCYTFILYNTSARVSQIAPHFWGGGLLKGITVLNQSSYLVGMPPHLFLAYYPSDHTIKLWRINVVCVYLPTSPITSDISTCTHGDACNHFTTNIFISAWTSCCILHPINFLHFASGALLSREEGA